MRPPPPTRRSIAIVVSIACGVIAAYLVALRVEAAYGPPERRWYRWLSDDDDRDAYFRIAQYYPTGRVPYRDTLSEYPTIATLVISAPYWIAGGAPDAPLSRRAFHARWTTIMGGVLAITVGLIASFRLSQGLGPWPALLLLGPSALYFSLMRYDIVCALMVCASLAWFARGRYVLAHVVFAVATLTKWYPAVVFPVYLAFHLSGARGRLQFRPPQLMRAVGYGAAFAATVLAIVSLTIAWVSWDAFLVPYRFHDARGAQYFNPYWVIEQWRDTLGIGPAEVTWVNRAFLAL